MASAQGILEVGSVILRVLHVIASGTPAARLLELGRGMTHAHIANQAPGFFEMIFFLEYLAPPATEHITRQKESRLTAKGVPIDGKRSPIATPQEESPFP